MFTTRRRPAPTLTPTTTLFRSAAITAGTTGAAVDATGAAPGTPTATGTLTDTDVDNTPNTFTAVSSPTASAGGYGIFTMTARSEERRVGKEGNCTVQAFNVRETLTDTFTVTTIDDNDKLVTITITGTSGAADTSGSGAWSAVVSAADVGAAPGAPTATGTLTDTDADNAPNAFTAVSSPTASAGGYGIFTMTA